MKSINSNTLARKPYASPEFCISSPVELQCILAESNDIDPGADDPWGDY